MDISILALKFFELKTFQASIINTKKKNIFCSGKSFLKYRLVIERKNTRSNIRSILYLSSSSYGWLNLELTTVNTA